MGKSFARQITLKDIAKATGFSVNTVSRALRGMHDIAKRTRDKITDKAQEMGYVNNTLASSLRLGYTNTIAVILGDISNLNFALMMLEIENHARRHGYSSFLINSNEDDAIEGDAIRTALNKSVDGVIICPTQRSTDNIQYLKSTGLPFVLIGRRFGCIDTDYVVCDDEEGGYLAVRNLIVRGHRRILMLNGPAYISSAQERFAGYVRAHEEFGLRVSKDLIRDMDVTGVGCEMVADDLVRGTLDCTAIFAFSDLIAWNLWANLKRRNIKIPQAYSIVGFDHIQSHFSFPGELSSVDSFIAKMAVASVDLLVGKIRNGKSESTQIIVPTEFVPGETITSPCV